MVIKNKEQPFGYTLVIHQARTKMNITINEYCVADSIYHLSNNPASTIKGWCFATKNAIANFLGLTEKTIWAILAKLIEKNIVEKNPDDNRYLRTTVLWYDNVILLKLRSGKRYKDTTDTLTNPQAKPNDTTGSNILKTKDTYNIQQKADTAYVKSIVMSFIKECDIDTASLIGRDWAIYTKMAKNIAERTKDINLIQAGFKWLNSQTFLKVKSIGALDKMWQAFLQENKKGENTNGGSHFLQL